MKYSIDTQLEIWNWILPSVALGQYFTNPFRPDNHADCYLRLYNNTVFLTDWAYPEYNKYSCVHAIMNDKNIVYADAIKLIDYYLFYKDKKNYNRVLQTKISKTNSFKELSNDRANIFFTPFINNGIAAWSKKSKEYWKKREITREQLEKDRVFDVWKFYINNKIIIPKTYPCFAYILPSTNIKIYQPFSDKRNKWFSCTKKEDIWYWTKKSDTLIITKSYKDGRILFNNTDFDVCAFQNEGVIPNIDTFINLYSKVIIIYDNDTEGVKKSLTLLNYMLENYPNIYTTQYFFPESLGKDADECFINNKEAFKKEICNFGNFSISEIFY